MNPFVLLIDMSASTEITNELGNKVGAFDYTICDESSKLPVGFQYSAGLFYYTSQIENFSWPVAFLNHIEVSERYLGHGSRGLELFYSKVRQQCIKLCMLRVGWNKPEDEDYNLNWYKKRGWTLLNDAPPWRNPLYLMYKWI